MLHCASEELYWMLLRERIDSYDCKMVCNRSFPASVLVWNGGFVTLLTNQAELCYSRVSSLHNKLILISICSCREKPFSATSINQPCTQHSIKYSPRLLATGSYLPSTQSAKTLTAEHVKPTLAETTTLTCKRPSHCCKSRLPAP
jgi:hypothetical protein